MNLNSESGRSARLYAVSLVIATMLFCAPAFGQEKSTDRDKPTLLTSSEINDDLDGSGDEYFYKFSVGAGS